MCAQPCGLRGNPHALSLVAIYFASDIKRHVPFQMYPLLDSLYTLSIAVAV